MAAPQFYSFCFARIIAGVAITGITAERPIGLSPWWVGLVTAAKSNRATNGDSYMYSMDVMACRTRQLTHKGGGTERKYA